VTGLVSITSNVRFTLRIDAVVQRSTSDTITLLDNPQCSALTFKSGALTAGAHTVDIQVDATGLGVGQVVNIRPVTAANREHASLLIEEATA